MCVWGGGRVGGGVSVRVYSCGLSHGKNVINVGIIMLM